MRPGLAIAIVAIPVQSIERCHKHCAELRRITLILLIFLQDRFASKQAAFGKAGDFIADDDVIEHAYVDQFQCLAQSFGDAYVGLAGFAYTGRVIVGEDR